METVEKIIANGFGAENILLPIINATCVMDTLDGIAISNKFDARPSLMQGTAVTQSQATVFKVWDKGDRYLYLCTTVADSQRFDRKNTVSAITQVYFYVNKAGMFDNGESYINLVIPTSDGKYQDVNSNVLSQNKTRLMQVLKHNIFFMSSLMTFLNCRNIVLVDKPQRPSIARHYEKRHKIPQVVYKELEVTPISYRHNYKATSVPANSIPLHLCRGHIKTYTEEKPLFGRITGQFYWHPHMRGNKDNGEVVKDYKLVN